MQIDSLSNVLVAGVTSSTNFPVVNAYQSTAPTNQGGLYGDYGFLTKFTPDGSSFVYSPILRAAPMCPTTAVVTLAGRSRSAASREWRSTRLGNAYVAGATNTYDFPVTSAAYLATDSTQMNAFVGFVSKINRRRQSAVFDLLLRAFWLYRHSRDRRRCCRLGIHHGTFIQQRLLPGYLDWNSDPSVSGVACSYAFITKFDATASTLVYSTFLGARTMQRRRRFFSIKATTLTSYPPPPTVRSTPSMRLNLMPAETISSW